MTRWNEFYLLPYSGDPGVYALQFRIINSLKDPSEALEALMSYGNAFSHKALHLISKLAEINHTSRPLQDLYQNYSQSLQQEDRANYQQVLRDAAKNRALDQFIFKPYLLPDICRSQDHREFLERLIAVIRDRREAMSLIRTYDKITLADKWYVVSDFAGLNPGRCAAKELRTIYVQTLKGSIRDFNSVRDEVKGTLNADDREIWGLGRMCQHTMPIDFIMIGIALSGARTVSNLIESPWETTLAISVLFIFQLVFYLLYKLGVRCCDRRTQA